MTPTEWREHGAWLDYKGLSIFYIDSAPEVADNKPVLLCIHGLPTSSWDWHKLWPSLISDYRVIALDMIGLGFSDKPKRFFYSLLEQASLHEHLLDKLSISHCHILAHDYGDSVAQELLARFVLQKFMLEGYTLESICFLNGGLFPESHKALLSQKLLATPLGYLMMKLATEETTRAGFNKIFGPNTAPGDDDWQGFWYLMNLQQGRLRLPKLMGYMRERRLLRRRWLEAMQQTDIPLKLAVGPEDPISGRSLLTRYRELFPEGDITELSGLGHYPHIEDPTAVLEVFRHFHQ